MLRAFLLSFVLVGLSVRAAAPASALRFSPAGSNEFSFDTGVLKGKLRAGGKSTGFSSVVHVPTGERVDGSMGLLSPYRIFSSNKRYGTAAWDWPSQAHLLAEGGVEVLWSPAPERPFELRAVYRLTAPTVLDFETTLTARTNLNGLELFLASYFAAGFTNSLVYVKSNHQAWLMRADRECGVWLAFPRDNQAVSLIQDGRWKLEPNPVDWVIMPQLAKPLGIRKSPANDVRAVVMSLPEDCFALSTPFELEPHRSLYLSLFGRDLKAGETARARARLVIRSDLSGEGIDAVYNDYLRQMRAGPAGQRN